MVPSTSTKSNNEPKDNYKLAAKKNTPPTRRFTKDEKRLREAGIFLDIKSVIGLPMEEFNQLISRQRFTEEKQELCRDVRKRGKNKWAAQNCRKRKIDQLDELSEKVKEAVENTSSLQRDHEKLLNEYDQEARKLNCLIQKVLNYHNKSCQQYHIQVTNDGVKITHKSEIKAEDIVPQPVEKYRLKLGGTDYDNTMGSGSGAGQAQHNNNQHDNYSPRTDNRRNENPPYQPGLLEGADALVPSTSALPCSPDEIDEELRFFMH